MSNNSLVFLNGNQAVTTSLAIAEGTQVQHKNVLELVRTHLVDFETFGLVAFETRARPVGQHGGGDVEYAILNERQATLLITYMRNSDIVREFKKRLVKAFFEFAQCATQPSSLVKYENEHAAAELVSAYVKAAKAFGFEGNQAILSANNAVKNITGVNLLQLMEQVHLIAPDQEQLLTVSDIGLRISQKSRQVNKLLIETGLQTVERDHKNRLIYELTTLGQSFGVYLDTAKRRSNGTAVRQIKWRASVIDLLNSNVEEF